jgi:hypothetical protein
MFLVLPTLQKTARLTMADLMMSKKTLTGVSIQLSVLLAMRGTE